MNTPNNCILNALEKNYNLVYDFNNPDILIYDIFNIPKTTLLNYSKSFRILNLAENITPNSSKMFNYLPCDIYLGFDYNIDNCFFNLPFSINYIKPYEIDLNNEKNLNIHDKSYINYYDKISNITAEEDKYNYFYKMTNDKVEELFKIKDEFCCSLISNDKYNGHKGIPSSHLRTALINMISEKYKKINNGGKHINNINEIIDYDKEEQWISKHKFMVALENTIHNGYITEKIFKAKRNGCIPIYLGSQEMKGFNKNSFIFINKDDIKISYNSDNTLCSYINM